MRPNHEHPRFTDAHAIAQICHEANRSYCSLFCDDDSQKPWVDAAEWQQEIIINGVLFRMDNPGVTPAQMHSNWMEEMIKEGWVYGETKDELSKTHPCIVEYDALPEHQKKKDDLFSAIVDALS